ncbi:MAG TPA: hypothetical protein VM901_11050 [Bdellovibrionota bacterium]|jgi:hypothetical protein|nr:hypothetical protein [Bdellovibrionota bacterium]
MMKLAMATVLFAVSAGGGRFGCVPTDFKGEGSGSSNHGGGGGGGWSLSSLFGGGSGGGGDAHSDMDGIELLGAKGKWPDYVNAMASKEIDSHPNLVNGIPGRGNPLAGICDNYMSLNTEQRKTVLMKVAPPLSYGESHFGFKGNGGEHNRYRRSYGPFQISHGAESWGCWQGGYKPMDWRSNLDCVYKIFDGQYTRKGLPIANNQSYWSVMRPSRYLSSRFMKTFKDLAPECNSSVAVRPTKAFPGAKVIDSNNTGAG